MRFKHKLTGEILELIKDSGTVSKMLVVNEPTRMFYGRRIPNRRICFNKNLEKIDD